MEHPKLTDEELAPIVDDALILLRHRRNTFVCPVCSTYTFDPGETIINCIECGERYLGPGKDSRDDGIAFLERLKAQLARDLENTR